MAVFRIKNGEKVLMAEVNKVERVNNKEAQTVDGIKNITLDAGDIFYQGDSGRTIKQKLDEDFVKLENIATSKGVLPTGESFERKQVLVGLEPIVNAADDGKKLTIRQHVNDVEKNDPSFSFDFPVTFGEDVTVRGSTQGVTFEVDQSANLKKEAIHKSAVNKAGLPTEDEDEKIQQVLTGMAVTGAEKQLNIKIFGSNVEGEGASEDQYINAFALRAGSGIEFKSPTPLGDSPDALSAVTIENTDHADVAYLKAKSRIDEDDKVLTWTRENGLLSDITLVKQNNIIRLLGKTIDNDPEKDPVHHDLGHVELAIGTAIAYTKVLRWTGTEIDGFTGEPDSVRIAIREALKATFPIDQYPNGPKVGGYLVIGFYTKSSAGAPDSEATINYTFAFLSDYIVDLIGGKAIEIKEGKVNLVLNPNTTDELSIKNDKLLYKPIYFETMAEFENSHEFRPFKDGTVIYVDGESKGLDHDLRMHTVAFNLTSANPGEFFVANTNHFEDEYIPRGGEATLPLNRESRLRFRTNAVEDGGTVLHDNWTICYLFIERLEADGSRTNLVNIGGDIEDYLLFGNPNVPANAPWIRVLSNVNPALMDGAEGFPKAVMIGAGDGQFDNAPTIAAIGPRILVKKPGTYFVTAEWWETGNDVRPTAGDARGGRFHPDARRLTGTTIKVVAG